MEKTKKGPDPSKEILKLLHSGKEVSVLDGLKKTRQDGSPKLIPTLVEILSSDKSSLTVVKATTNVLYELKDENCIDPLVEQMMRDDLGENRAIVISSFWNSGLDPSQYLNKFVQVAISGSYMDCLECITVIENMEGPFEESVILDAMVSIRENLSKADESKQDLLMSLHALLEHMDRELD